jgi:hypothetical protein
VSRLWSSSILWNRRLRLLDHRKILHGSLDQLSRENWEAKGPEDVRMTLTRGSKP